MPLEITIEYCINRLKRLRDDYSDEIPNERICSMRKVKNFKVRGAWWQMLANTKHFLDTGKSY